MDAEMSPVCGSKDIDKVKKSSDKKVVRDILAKVSSSQKPDNVAIDEKTGDSEFTWIVQGMEVTMSILTESRVIQLAVWPEDTDLDPLELKIDV
jgi:hypothetical protein